MTDHEATRPNIGSRLKSERVQSRGRKPARTGAAAGATHFAVDCPQRDQAMGILAAIAALAHLWDLDPEIRYAAGSLEVRLDPADLAGADAADVQLFREVLAAAERRGEAVR